MRIPRILQKVAATSNGRARGMADELARVSPSEPEPAADLLLELRLDSGKRSGQALPRAKPPVTS